MIIPITKLRDFYNLMRIFSINTHIKILKDFNRGENYKKLIEIFNDSKKHFEKYCCSDKFTIEDENKRKPLPISPIGIKKTNDLVAILKNNDLNIVNNNKNLSFQYLAREVSPLRTTGNAKFESGQSGRSSGTGGLDFIGWNVNNNIPILGEIKVNSDENPFFALIQLLTYLSELVTPNQINRINKTGLFANHISEPVFYLYIILSNYNYNSKPRTRILQETIVLANKLKKEIDEIFEISILEINEPNGLINEVNNL
jgi:hypothetical protein